MILTLFCQVERKIRYVVWLGNTTEFTDWKLKPDELKNKLNSWLGRLRDPFMAKAVDWKLKKINK